MTFVLPPIVSVSAPTTRVPSRLPSPKRATSSLPTSPRSGVKKQSKTFAIPMSPARPLRKHTYAATFGTSTRADRLAGDGPKVHSYADVISTLKTSGATAFNKVAAREEPPRWCDVSSYSDPRSTLKTTGATPFSTEKFARGAAHKEGPDVHCYREPLSTLKTNGAAVFGSTPLMRTDSKASLCPVHCYTEPRSTLSRAGATAFGKDKTERGALDQGRRAEPPVHAYQLWSSISTLRTTGVATFGDAAAARPNLTRVASTSALGFAQSRVGRAPKLAKTTKTHARLVPSLETQRPPPLALDVD